MVTYRRKVLLAVDGSDQAFEAVRYVSQLFLPNRIEVVLFHSFWEAREDPAYRHRQAFIAEWMIEQEKAIQEFLERARRLFLARGVPEDAVVSKIKERKFGIVRDIVEECQSGYDALVVGRQGMSKLKDLVLGSIAKELIRCKIHIPLCVVGGTPKVGRVLLGMDASGGAMKPIDEFGTMLAFTDCEVACFHVISSDSVIACADGEFQKAERDAKICLEKAVCHLEQTGLSRDRITTKIAAGTATCPRAIVEEARDGGYGTIVVGRRSLSGVKQYFIGRVSNKVLKLAKEMAVWVVS
ncbi:MAG: universal stress protein [Deltaproteobacteria bacterium]|nr:MAG: universal stress protein [Deltaproteobacteria bacterium]